MGGSDQTTNLSYRLAPLEAICVVLESFFLLNSRILSSLLEGAGDSGAPHGAVGYRARPRSASDTGHLSNSLALSLSQNTHNSEMTRDRGMQAEKTKERKEKKTSEHAKQDKKERTKNTLNEVTQHKDNIL